MLSAEEKVKHKRQNVLAGNQMNSRRAGGVIHRVHEDGSDSPVGWLNKARNGVDACAARLKANP